MKIKVCIETRKLFWVIIFQKWYLQHLQFLAVLPLQSTLRRIGLQVLFEASLNKERHC